VLSIPSPIQRRKETLYANDFKTGSLRRDIENSERFFIRKLSLREKEKSITDCKELGFNIKRKSMEGTFVNSEQVVISEVGPKPPAKNHKKNCKVFMNSIKNFKQALENIDIDAPEDDIPTRRQHWFEPAKVAEISDQPEDEINPLEKTCNLINDQINSPEPRTESDDGKKNKCLKENVIVGDYYSKEFCLGKSFQSPENLAKESKKAERKDRDMMKQDKKVCMKECVGCSIF
jgi:hypothetical protein